ncbi:hypothetical protein HDU99_007832, partial [Rhizoclosmatium hyalinum]
YHIKQNLSLVFSKTSELTTAICTCLTDKDLDMEHRIESVKSRNALVSDIQTCFGAIDAGINQAASEITYAHYNLAEFKRIVKACKGVAAVLFSMQTVLVSPESIGLLASPDFQEKIDEKMRDAWFEFDESCRDVFAHLEFCLRGVAITEVSMGEVEEKARHAIDVFRRHQAGLFESMFYEDEEVVEGRISIVSEAKRAWEKLLQINYYILATKE